MIYFIRHAESNFNSKRRELKQKYGESFQEQKEFLQHRFNLQHVDSPISPKGQLQANQARIKMSQIEIDLVVVSPLRRALQTCDIIFSKHKSKPKIIVDPLIRQYLQSSCDIGCTLPQSMNKYHHFDFQKISVNPHTWYIKSINNEQEKQSIKKKLHGLQSKQLNRAAQQFTLKYLINWREMITKNPTLLQKEKSRLKNQKQYIKQTYAMKNKTIAIVSHSENIKAYFQKPVENCEILQIPFTKM